VVLPQNAALGLERLEVEGFGLVVPALVTVEIGQAVRGAQRLQMILTQDAALSSFSQVLAVLTPAAPTEAALA